MSTPAGGPSLIKHGMPGQGAPVRGRSTLVLLLVRIIIGMAAVIVGVRVAIGHGATVAHAADWALPAPSLAVWLGSLVLIVFGVGLVVGLASRLCALVLLVVLLVVAVTAGRVEGGLPLFGSALLVAGSLIVVARGGGAPQLLDRLDPRAW